MEGAKWAPSLDVCCMQVNHFLHLGFQCTAFLERAAIEIRSSSLTLGISAILQYLTPLAIGASSQVRNRKAEYRKLA